jgi:hypothetical protein
MQQWIPVSVHQQGSASAVVVGRNLLSSRSLSSLSARITGVLLVVRAGGGNAGKGAPFAIWVIYDDTWTITTDDQLT